ncbi:MAG: phosphoribosylformylglycinamidine synthase subunit PurL [Candidatus Thorarchaeota archaeon]|nr:phosphoribosylformylglycinamidine synthase subunit PurL [Candidatus Thorarchaeota archaeon]
MLNKSELEYAKSVLGREPTQTELGMLDVLWSEHCSYKSSKRWFYLFKTEGEKVALGIGEGAGLVDIGDGYLIGVAMESHNHPSQIDPYNGAATGVGGIIRDVISQGCKAVGLMNCLRFGPPSKPRNAYLLENVVRGISEYGNSVGIPVVGGELEFDDSYDDNCLVNVVCVGWIKPEYIVRSKAKTTGHHLVLFGSTTGRDGIAGVSFASETFSDDEDENRGAVQIGDPLSKKVLIDTLQELVEEKLLEGLQDFGGGGMTSAAGELASAGGTGVEIDLDKVPLREADMEPWEIVISESQERMLGIVAPENLDRVILLLEKNDTPYGIIGKVTDDKHYTAKWNGEIKARLPIDLLVGGFPVPERVEGKITPQTESMSWFNEPEDYRSILLELIESINICDRSWVYSQYDQHVQSNTVVDLGENGGVLEFPNGRLLAFTSDCNSFWCLLDPQQGTANSACESLRNLISMGASPIFIADCLNFGNPERPESYCQFVESVRGLGRFSHDFNIPIVGGNVSLYNESSVDNQAKRINPTPQIMIAGIFERNFTPVRRNLCTPWANIFLIGETLPELNGSEFQRITIGQVKGIPPRYRPDEEKRGMNVILEAHKKGLIRSCNNVGRGGIAAALLKMALNSHYGFKLNLDYIPGTVSSVAQRLFSETSGRYLAEVTESNQPEFLTIVEKYGSTVCELGLTIADPIADFGRFSIPMKEVKDAYSRGLRKYME